MKKETRGFLTNPKSKKLWTTLSVDLDLKDKLDSAMQKQEKKRGYNSLLHRLLDEYLSK